MFKNEHKFFYAKKNHILDYRISGSQKKKSDANNELELKDSANFGKVFFA
jgi:hypothetical protein